MKGGKTVAKTANIASVAEKLITPCTEELGYKVWDVEFVKEGSGWFLRVTIDSDNGIDIDDCEKVSRAISPLLDEADPIEQNYTLEVSSPGLERTLRTPAHFAACAGEEIEVRLYSPDESGSKAYKGKLVSSDEENFTIEADGTEKTFEISKVAKANVFFDFTDIE